MATDKINIIFQACLFSQFFLFSVLPLARYLTGMVDKRTLEKYEREAKEKNRETWWERLVLCCSFFFVCFILCLNYQSKYRFDYQRLCHTRSDFKCSYHINPEMNMLVVGTCRGLWTQTRRRGTKGRQSRSGGLTLRLRKNTSLSWTPPDTRALSPTWLVERHKPTWQSWWDGHATNSYTNQPQTSPA